MQRIEYLWDSSFRFARITQKRMNTLPNSEVGMMCCGNICMFIFRIANVYFIKL